MTDRTPASPVEVLAAALNTAQLSPYEFQLGRDLTVPAYRILAALESAGYALQAQDHTDTKGGLDVERLAQTMHARHPGSILPECLRHDRREAAELAREYAALEPTHD